MSDSSFRINQPPGTPYPNYDRARRDIVAGSVECEAFDKSGPTTYLYEIVSEPPDSSIVISGGTTHTCTFTVAKRGGYLVRLTVDA